MPLAVFQRGSSRHFPDIGFTSVPLAGCHCWLEAPVQVHRSTGVLLAVPPRWTSRHLPLIRIVPSFLMVQFCASLPSHCHITMLVPFTTELPGSSRHTVLW